MQRSLKNLLAAAVLAVFVFGVAAFAQTARPPGRSLTVTTQPGAAIWVDGVFFGKTGADGKLSIRSLPAGNRTLRVRLDGFKEVRKPLGPATKGALSVPVTVPADEAEKALQEAEALNTRDRQKAIAAFENAIRLRPNYPEALLGLARARSEGGDIEGAIKTIAALKRVKPRYAEASAVEGRIFKDLDDEKKAVAAFKRSIAEGGGFQPEAYTGLGLLYKEKAETAAADGDFTAEAANYVESARYLSVAAKQLSVSPDAPVVYQLLGLSYERQNKYAEAIKIYEDFLALFPDSPEASAVQSFIVQIKKQMETPE